MRPRSKKRLETKPRSSVSDSSGVNVALVSRSLTSSIAKK